MTLEQRRQDVDQEVEFSSIRVEYVAEGGGEVEITFASVGGAAHGAKRVDNRSDVVAAGGVGKEATGLGDGV